MDNENRYEVWDSLLKAWNSGRRDYVVEQAKIRANAGDVEFQEYLGWIYFSQDEGMRDLNKARDWFEKAAATKSPNGVFGLACVEYTENDFDGAYQHYREAEALGYGGACFWIGYMHLRGFGQPKSVDKAVEWFKRGWDLGFFRAGSAYYKIQLERASLPMKPVWLVGYAKLLVQGMVTSFKNANSPYLDDIPKARNVAQLRAVIKRVNENRGR